MAGENALLETILDKTDAQVNQFERSKELINTIQIQQAESGTRLEQDTAASGMPDGRGGRTTPLVIQAEELSMLNAQNQARQAAAAMGSNMDDSSEILTKLSSEVKDSALNAIDKAKIVDEKTSAKFLDDPLKYLYSQITLDSSIEDSKAANARYTIAKDASASIQQLTQELPKTTAAIAATRSAETVQSKMEAAQAAINAAVDRIKIDNAGINIQSIRTLNELNAQQIQALGTAYSAKNQEENLKLSKASFALQVKQTNLAIEERMDRLENNKIDRQGEVDLSDMVKKGAASLGYKNIDAFPPSKILQMLKLKDNRFQEFLNIGMLSTATGSPTISDDPGKVAKILVVTNAPLNPAQEPVKKFLKGVWGDITDPNKPSAGVDISKIDSVTRAVGILAIKRAQTQQTNIDYRDSSNIYSAPPIESIAAIPAVANTEFFKQVIAPQLAGVKQVNPDQILSLTAEAIKLKKLTFDQGTNGLHTFFSAAVLQNNATKNYSGLGLPNQTSYNTMIPNGIGIDRKHNLIDASQINTLLSVKMKAGTYADYQINPFGGGFR